MPEIEAIPTPTDKLEEGRVRVLRPMKHHETPPTLIMVGEEALSKDDCDLIIAEPNALIGFAGPRVIEQTVREKLPEGFQRSEFLLEHCAIDMVVSRGELREVIAEAAETMGFGSVREVDAELLIPDQII